METFVRVGVHGKKRKTIGKGPLPFGSQKVNKRILISVDCLMFFFLVILRTVLNGAVAGLFSKLGERELEREVLEARRAQWRRELGVEGYPSVYVYTRNWAVKDATN